MFNIVETGGHKGTVDTLAVHLHAARKHLASSLVALGPPSVNDTTTNHHVMASSPRLPMQASSHLVICHMGSGCVFTGETLIM